MKAKVLARVAVAILAVVEREKRERWRTERLPYRRACCGWAQTWWVWNLLSERDEEGLRMVERMLDVERCGLDLGQAEM